MNEPGSGKSKRRKHAKRAARATEIPRVRERLGRYRVQAGDFKAVCLSLMDEVRETGVEYVITKRGRPVAKLSPLTDEDVRPFVNRSRGVIEADAADVLASIGEDWEVDADL